MKNKKNSGGKKKLDNLNKIQTKKQIKQEDSLVLNKKEKDKMLVQNVSILMRPPQNQKIMKDGLDV